MTTPTDNTSPKSGSERLKNYRSAMTASGYVRSEVVIPSEIKAAAESIAKVEGVRVMDVLSAFTELGLKAYRAETSSVVPLAAVAEVGPQVFGAVSAMAASASSPEISGSSRSVVEVSSSVTESPIAAFIRKRKG